MKHKRVLPRRLRIGFNPGPRWIITVPQDASRDFVEQLAMQWKQAGRADGTLVVTDNIKVERGRR